MSENPIRILGIGTAVPMSVEQTRIMDIAVRLFKGTDEQRNVLRRIYARSGVERRGVVLDDVGELTAFYAEDESPSTASRMKCYERFAPALAERAARAALEQASTPVERITHLITVSCTGFASPGFDAALIERLHLSRSVKRTNIGFMGCHAALNAIEVARSIARASSEARVLICCVELCSLHLAYGWEMQKIVSNALFADGAASLVIGQSDDASRWRIVETASFLMPDTKREMGWTIGDNGFAMTLSPHVPAQVEANIRGWCDAWLGEAGANVEAIDHWAIHPGGPRVLCAAAAGLKIDAARLQVSRDVLREHGNMSSTTVLFILQKLGDAKGNCVSLAFGPGLVMEGLLLRR